jgi:hypothetical protein
VRVEPTYFHYTPQRFARADESLLILILLRLIPLILHILIFPEVGV